jgi:hypothetical protein
MKIRELDSVVKGAVLELERRQESVTTFINNLDLLESCPFNFTWCDSKPRLVIEKLEDLTEARQVMREIHGTWHDEFNHSFYSCGYTISTWRSSNTNWEIWLECSIEDFPAELKKLTCQWQETTETTYNLVCEVE